MYCIWSNEILIPSISIVFFHLTHYFLLCNWLFYPFCLSLPSINNFPHYSLERINFFIVSFLVSHHFMSMFLKYSPRILPISDLWFESLWELWSFGDVIFHLIFVLNFSFLMIYFYLKCVVILHLRVSDSLELV